MNTYYGADWDDARSWVQGLEDSLVSSEKKAEVLVLSFRDLTHLCDALFQAMDFSFLYDPQRQTFHIGYNVTTSGLDLNYYDLLASEARLTSLVAIAKGDVPQSHWLHLGRPFTRVDGRQALIS
jgi:cyclic beta-1,2-glucan synthetase